MVSCRLSLIARTDKTEPCLTCSTSSRKAVASRTMLRCRKRSAMVFRSRGGPGCRAQGGDTVRWAGWVGRHVDSWWSSFGSQQATSCGRAWQYMCWCWRTTTQCDAPRRACLATILARLAAASGLSIIRRCEQTQSLGRQPSSARVPLYPAAAHAAHGWQQQGLPVPTCSRNR